MTIRQPRSGPQLMTHRKFKNTEKGYDRAQAEREAQSAVEADMLFGDQPESGLADLMSDGATPASSGPQSSEGGWDLPKTLGTSPAEGSETAPTGTEATPTSSEAQTVTSGSVSQPTPIESEPDQPSAPQAAMSPTNTDPQKITTVVRRSARSRREQPKKKGFFGRLFGR